MTKTLSNEEFIQKAINKHGNKYDYSLTQYTISHNYITIICPEHGEFTQKAYAHLNYGCRKCSNGKNGEKSRTKIENFIERSNAIHEDKYDYTKSILEGQHKKIIISCPIHGDFTQLPNDHLKGRGCKKCGSELGGLKSKNRIRITTEQFISKAKKIHGDKYDYSETLYKKAAENVIITCSKHGNFSQIASNHLNGQGCPSCGRDKNAVFFLEFLNRARQKHGDKYDYVEFDKGVAKKCEIICPEHGSFSQFIMDHLDGHGCPYCAKKSVIDKLTKSSEEVIKMIYEKFGDYFDIILDDYKNMDSLIQIFCPIHGEFKQTANNFLMSKHGCAKCSDVIGGNSIRLTQEEFEERANNIHNKKYKYGIYKISNEKMEIICPKHGVFLQTPKNHLHGYSCPSCGRGCNQSKMQNSWLNMLGISNDDREKYLKIENKSIIVDAYVSETNTIYEFWGDFWHGNPNVYNLDDINTVTNTTFRLLYEKTQQKRKVITNAGYKLIEIWENDWKRINDKIHTRNIYSNK